MDGLAAAAYLNGLRLRAPSDYRGEMLVTARPPYFGA